MKMVTALTEFDRRVKAKYPRAYPWLWFVGLYLAGMTALMIFASLMHWMIKG